MGNYRFIVSGGGTGGHIFPAISIAEGLRDRFPGCEILFVGAEGKMEMHKVPAAGFKIVGLPVAGFNRKKLWKNISFIPKLIKSLILAKAIIDDFKPDIAIGVGGYASGPLLRVASRRGIPCILQEQNSYPGATNRILRKKVRKICVAYDHMERFFPKEKIVFTGNPIRKDLVTLERKSDEAYNYFNLDRNKPVILILGGSQGSKTINQCMINNLGRLRNLNASIIWQSGKYYYKNIEFLFNANPPEHIRLMEFIPRMDYAYALADLVISRAGAGTISELCMVGTPTILVPSPNVSDDHQTKNAMALVKKDAAVLVKDKDALKKLIPTTFELLKDNNRRALLAENIQKMATPHATDDIVKVIATYLMTQNDSN